jgi:hypothetical protein
VEALPNLSVNKNKDIKKLNKYSLIAPCGMNCGVCMAYLRERNKCQGCRNDEIKKSITRTRCKIKNCNTFESGKAKFCFDCKTFPCYNLQNLDRRYRKNYSMSMIENLESIKNIGIRRFFKNEDARWKCSNCGGKICVHKGYCINCKIKS